MITLKLLVAGLTCLASSGKYYYDKITNVRDREFDVMTLAQAKESQSDGDEAHTMRTQAWLKIVFQENQVPFIGTVKTTSPAGHITSRVMAMPSGKEYSQALSDSDAEFISSLDKVRLKDNEYNNALEDALRLYLKKRSEYTSNLIATHLKDCPGSLVTVYYDHVGCGGQAYENMLENNGSYSVINLDFVPRVKKTPLVDKHGYLADRFIKLSNEAARGREHLKPCAEKLAEEDFNTQAGILLHEIGHIYNKDNQHRRSIKKVLPHVTTLLGVTALVAAQRNPQTLIATALCVSGAVAVALTTPCLMKHHPGPNIATWLRAYSGEYRADSYALQHANISQLQHFQEYFAKQSQEIQRWLDEHPTPLNRIKRIEKRIKELTV